MAKRKQLSKYANISLQKEYLRQCDLDIKISRNTLTEAKRKIKRMQKAIKLQEQKIYKLKEKRKEILNLK